MRNPEEVCSGTVIIEIIALLVCPHWPSGKSLCGEVCLEKSTSALGCPADYGLELWDAFSMSLLGVQIAMLHQ